MREGFPSAFAGAHVALSVICALAALIGIWRIPGVPGRTNWRWIAMIAVVLLVGRWPTLLFPYALNPDESQLIAGAHTLTVDPIFWRSVNGMTSGPLNFFALWPAGLVFGFNTYVGARITALVLIAIALSAAHVTLARRFGEQAARFGGLPTLYFLAFTAQPDFTHYSSELLSTALLSLAIMLATGLVWEKTTSRVREILIGLLLGLLPLAKPQLAPLGFLIGVALLAWMLRRRAVDFAALGRIVVAALVPTLFALAVIYRYNLHDYVFSNYLEQNFFYVDTSHLTWGETAFRLVARLDPTCPLYFAWIGTSAMAAVLGLSWLRLPSKENRTFLFCSGGALLIALACILLPRRPFPHYLLQAMVPWTLFFGALMGCLLHGPSTTERHRRTRIAARGLGIVMALILISVRFKMPYPPRESLTPYLSDFTGQITAVIHSYTRPGDQLAVWGWRPDLYVLADLPQAVRDGVTESSINAGPFQQYAQSQFIDDLRRNRPAVFVDGVGPGNFNFDRREEQSPAAVFPELANWLTEGYTLVGDLRGSRVYVRKDRTRESHLPRGAFPVSLVVPFLPDTARTVLSP